VTKAGRTNSRTNCQQNRIAISHQLLQLFPLPAGFLFLLIQILILNARSEVVCPKAWTQQPPKKNHFIKSCIGIIIINTLCHPHHHQQHPTITMPVVSPPSTTSSAGHTHLLSHYYGINGDSPSEQDSPTTILSRQFDGTQSLLK
jgi:hypothetical protein